MPTADAAIDILDRRQDITGAVVDLDLGRAWGDISLARTIRDLRPDVTLVLLTVGPRPINLPERVVYVRKPFDAAQLIAAIGGFHD